VYRFTIRDLVVITLLVALGLGWWSDHRGLVRNLENSRRSGVTEALSDVLRKEGFAIQMYDNAVSCPCTEWGPIRIQTPTRSKFQLAESGKGGRGMESRRIPRASNEG